MKTRAAILLTSSCLLVACGGNVVVDSSGSAGAGGSTVTTTSSNTSSGKPCAAHAANGCCFGDGQCCDCVSSTICTIGTFGDVTPAVTAFDDCVCQQGVCASACVSACAGGGIDNGCTSCAQQAAHGPCATQYTSCPGASSQGG